MANTRIFSVVDGYDLTLKDDQKSGNYVIGRRLIGEDDYSYWNTRTDEWVKHTDLCPSYYIYEKDAIEEAIDFFYNRDKRYDYCVIGV